MLNLLDESLEAFLRAEVPLAKRTVEISFDAPDSDWSAGVTKPTVNLYLWDVRRNADDVESGFEIVEDEEGNKSRQPPKPRVDCRYLVTAWTTETQDEHALLGQVLATMLANDHLPTEHMVESYAHVRPLPTFSVASADGKDQADFWSAVGGQLKPGLDLVVTATVDAGIIWDVGPDLDKLDIVLHDDGEGSSRRSFVGGHVADADPGTLVTTSRGSARTRAGGVFLVPAEEGEQVAVETEKRKTAKVPKDGPVDFD